MTESTTTPSWLVGTGKISMDESAKAPRKPFRFWLNRDSKSKIIFLSDGSDVPCIWEHQVKLRRKGKDDWNNYFTCLEASQGTCPLCAYAEEFEMYWKQQVQLYSIIELKPYRSKKTNKDVPYSRKILTAKKATSEILMRKYAGRLDVNSTLRGACFEVYRGTDPKSASVGTDFEFKAMVDLSKLPKEDTLPFDLNLFAPDRLLMTRVVERLMRGDLSGGLTHSSDTSGGINPQDLISGGVSEDDVGDFVIDYGDPQGNEEPHDLAIQL